MLEGLSNTNCLATLELNLYDMPQEISEELLTISNLFMFKYDN
jgi:hypothetical protein